MNEFEESGVGMKFTLKATAAKVYANYVTWLGVTTHPFPQAAIRTIFPWFCLWIRRLTPTRRVRRAIESKWALETKQGGGVIMVAKWNQWRRLWRKMTKQETQDKKQKPPHTFMNCFAQQIHSSQPLFRY